jgi:hypothetical protein
MLTSNKCKEVYSFVYSVIRHGYITPAVTKSDVGRIMVANQFIQRLDMHNLEAVILALPSLGALPCRLPVD